MVDLLHLCSTFSERMFRFLVETLNRHQIRIHATSPREHICSICGKEFVEKPTLIRHMRTHTGRFDWTDVFYRVATRTGKPGKMGRHFSVRQKSGICEQTGRKVRQNYTKYWKTHGNFIQILFHIFSDI